MDDTVHKMRWNSQLERVLCEEGERALCYSWLHSRSQKLYSGLDSYIALPVIVLSTVAGTASIGSYTILGESAASAFIVGALSISAGLLNTVSTYFSWGKRSEGHRIAGITYSKIHRFILIELSLPRNERMEAHDMLKIVREQLDRLQETSPQIPDKIIAEFKIKFKDTADVSKPEITNGLHAISVYVEGKSPIRISNVGHIPNTLQRSSLAHQPSASASDSSHS